MNARMPASILKLSRRLPVPPAVVAAVFVASLALPFHSQASEIVITDMQIGTALEVEGVTLPMAEDDTEFFAVEIALQSVPNSSSFFEDWVLVDSKSQSYSPNVVDMSSPDWLRQARWDVSPVSVYDDRKTQLVFKIPTMCRPSHISTGDLRLEVDLALIEIVDTVSLRGQRAPDPSTRPTPTPGPRRGFVMGRLVDVLSDVEFAHQKVHLVGENTGEVLTTETDADGGFSFEDVPDGDYYMASTSTSGERAKLCLAHGARVEVTVRSWSVTPDLGTLEIYWKDRATSEYGRVCTDKRARVPALRVDFMVFEKRSNAELEAKWEFAESKWLEIQDRWDQPLPCVICIVSTSTRVGTYGDDPNDSLKFAYSTTWKVTVVEVPSGKRHRKTFTVHPPKEGWSRNGIVLSGAPVPMWELIDWLELLSPTP